MRSRPIALIASPGRLPPRYSIMSDVLTSVRFPPETLVFERAARVRSFVVESQRRAIEHCGDFSKHRISLQNIAKGSPGWSNWPKRNCSVYTPDDRTQYDIAASLTDAGASGKAPEDPSMALPNFEDVLRGSVTLG
ncbi:hypothetical protein EI171_10010 [Bradyrhizobium sp. LCT2]|nr:hypothetical protein EI171_10010 [Bradyrhizobium sp. LCT2]